MLHNRDTKSKGETTDIRAFKVTRKKKEGSTIWPSLAPRMMD